MKLCTDSTGKLKRKIFEKSVLRRSCAGSKTISQASTNNFTIYPE